MKMKKYVMVFIIIFILLFCFIVLLGNNVNKYNSRLINQIKDNYDIDDISYANIYDNYYVIKSNSNIIVLDSDYNEVLIEGLDDKMDLGNMDIVYMNNYIMYMERLIKKNTIIYNYYNPTNMELIKSITIGGNYE